MKRPPNDGRPPGTPVRPEPTPQKPAASNGGVTSPAAAPAATAPGAAATVWTGQGSTGQGPTPPGSTTQGPAVQLPIAPVTQRQGSRTLPLSPHVRPATSGPHPAPPSLLTGSAALRGATAPAGAAPSLPVVGAPVSGAAVPTAPAVVVTRSIDVGPGLAPRARPAMPANASGAAAQAVVNPGTAGPAPAVPTPAVLGAVPGAPARAPLQVSSDAAKVPGVEPPPPSPSVRPPAPEMTKPNGTPNGAPASIADTFERLLGSDLDAGFASLERAPSASSGTGSGAASALTDYGEVRALFAELAANHVRPVRDFMIDLRWCDATVDWLPICEPALRSLRRAADKLELPALCGALDRFSAALTAAQSSEARTIGGDLRASLLESYEELTRQMPQAFALDLDRTQREGVILQALLLQVTDVKKVTLDKMYAAGLSTLDAMMLATPADIAATTGIAEVLAERIVARFRAYHEQVKATAPDANRVRERIAALTHRLRSEHDAYERAGQSWSRDAAERKKEHRRARAQTLLDIQVELARMGEVERLARLDRLPFDGKLTQLEVFLQDAKRQVLGRPLTES